MEEAEKALQGSETTKVVCKAVCLTRVTISG